VKIKEHNTLSSFDSRNLHVYANKTAFDNRNALGPMKLSHPIYELGTSEEDAIYVVVPGIRQLSSVPPGITIILETEP
jgi:hypothetical protein